MEISSFSRMRSYRKDGRTSALLKLVLPRSKDDGPEVFNGFYADLAECYSSVAEKLSEGKASALGPLVLSVDFEIFSQAPDALERENIIAIRRTHRIRCGDKYTCGTFVDLFDMKREIFIK